MDILPFVNMKYAYINSIQKLCAHSFVTVPLTNVICLKYKCYSVNGTRSHTIGHEHFCESFRFSKVNIFQRSSHWNGSFLFENISFS